MENDKVYLEEKVKAGFNISLSRILSDSFDLFGKGVGSYLLFMLLLVLVFFLSAFSIAISLNVVLVFVVLAILVIAPLVQVGFARFTKNLIEEGKADFNEFIGGYRFNFSQLVLQAGVVFVINMAITILPEINYYTDYFYTVKSGLEDPESFLENMLSFSEAYSDRGLLSFLLGIFSFYISLGLSLTPYIVSFYRVSAFTAMDISFRTINKVVFRAAVLQIALSLIILVGFLLLIVGSLAALPVYFIATYLLFRYTLGEKDMSEPGMKIDDHLVD